MKSRTGGVGGEGKKSKKEYSRDVKPDVSWAHWKDKLRRLFVM